MQVFTLVLLVLGRLSFGNAIQDADHSHEHGLDPYEEVLNLFNVSRSEFGVESLQTIVNQFSERLACDRGDENNGTDSRCLLSFCLNASHLLDAIGVGASGTVDEETFENISFVLLSIASNLNETCHSHIHATPDSVHNYRNNLTQLLNSYGSPQGLSVGAIQEFIEGLPLIGDDDNHDDDHGDDHDDDHDDDHADDHDDEHGDEHDEEPNGDHMDEHPEDDHGHEHNEDVEEHVEIFKDKCVGADVLFDQLEIKVTDVVPTGEIGHLLSLLVYHILKGSRVSRDCRVLPRQEFFPLSIFREHGVNGSLSHTEFEEILEELGIGKPQTAGSDDPAHDGHDHRRKRSIATTEFLFKDSWDGTCYTSDELLAIYDVDDDVSMTQFSDLCPALIQQQLSKACVSPSTPEEHSDDEKPSLAERYGYGSIATFIICVVSVVGALFVRCGSKDNQERLLHLFIGLAVGTLYSDALLHLIPQALGVHGHGAEDEHEHEGEGIVVEPYVWIAMVTSGGIYAFYLLEMLMSATTLRHAHGHISDNTNTAMSEKILSECQSDWILMRRRVTRRLIWIQTVCKGMAPVAFMVLLGDSVHNFLDGMAIGASFSSSVTLGISTSIAVLCHEVPHELGDFAILLKTGMPFCRALVVNFASALTAMGGFYIGVAISTNADTERWIIAVTAGMFLYISLVSMLPEMLKQATNSKRNVLLNNIGMLLGIAIMLLIAVFEEKIKI